MSVRYKNTNTSSNFVVFIGIGVKETPNIIVFLLFAFDLWCLFLQSSTKILPTSNLFLIVRES